ncbi:hypothetical protein Tco_1043602 [Tanacetum coccineum]|uniref:Uncharacterized protein n=1 Tax=Tanacetum coccineum TaxID=301880 RepID=A0ABQ5GMJ6_9ASTR
MAVLKSYAKHNMVAYLEKTDGNTSFHEIIDFLTRSFIHYALTVSPVVSTTFVEQFWMSAKSKIINNVRYITAKVAGKPVTISEASIRGDPLFDNADGIDTLNNQAIFDTIQLMGHLDAKKKFVMYPRLISVFLDKQLKNVPVPLDHFPINALTSKDEGEALDRQSEPQPTPSPPHPSVDQHETQPEPSAKTSPAIPIPDSIPEGSGGNHVDQAKEIKHLKAHIKKLKKKSKPVITHHKAWMKSGRKAAKAEPIVHKDPAFDDLDDNAMDYMETEDAQDEGRTSSVVFEEKESTEKGVSTEDPLSTAQPKVSTDKPEVSTAKPNEAKVSTDRQGEGTADQNEGKSATQTATTITSTPTPTIFGDDETIAQVLITMSQNKQKEKEKGVEIKNVEDTKRPRHTSTRSLLTLKPLPKIDPKDKGKKVIDEEGKSDTESDDITEAEKKFKMFAKDEEVARNVQEEWEAKEEKKRLAEEEATKVALTNEYDFIQARINADKILAEELQKEEIEKFTIEQRAKFLHDTIAAQRKFLAQQRKKHFDLKTKTFEEIQVLYERLKRQDQNFVAIGSAEDERQIKEMNEETQDPEKKRLKKRVVKEEDIAKVPAEQKVAEQGTKKRKSGHVKVIARKRPRPQPDDDSDDEHRKCLRIVTFESTMDSEIMETKSFIAKLHKVSSPDGNYLIVYRVNGHFRAFNYLMEGDLKIMKESSTKENDQGDFWNIQQEWDIIRWRLYEACGVYILELKDGTVIYMLVERREMITSQLQGKLWLYDEVRARLSGGEYEDKDEDFEDIKRSPYNDKDIEDTEDILKCLKDIICSYLLIESFVNPLYLKKAHSKKPCLHQVPYDKDDLANIFAPKCDETLIPEQERRSKLDKELITMLVEELLMPLAEKTITNANEFEKAVKEEMFDDLQYVQSLEKELDELHSDKTEFSNEYDLLLQECLSKDFLCAALFSMTDIDKYILKWHANI